MRTDIHLSVLDRIEIATPCHARWEDMKGDERTRFCGECSLHVHNISEMTRPDAEAFLLGSLDASRDGETEEDGGHAPQAPARRVCVRFFRRQDGTIITRDCPVGVAAKLSLLRHAARERMRRVGAMAILAATSCLAWASRQDRSAVEALEPFATVLAWLDPAKSPPPPSQVIMGDFAVGKLQVAPRSPTASGGCSLPEGR